MSCSLGYSQYEFVIDNWQTMYFEDNITQDCWSIFRLEIIIGLMFFLIDPASSSGGEMLDLLIYMHRYYFNVQIQSERVKVSQNMKYIRTKFQF